ncbi:hypothetical protein OK016_14890 [Vibrio chagasii]|nr:hypothetical protein [Vibrio chagasii]
MCTHACEIFGMHLTLRINGVLNRLKLTAMLGGMALKWAWREKMKKQGKPTDH